MYQLATAPRGIGQVLDSVFQLTRSAFAALLPYAIAAGALSVVPLAYLMATGALDNPAQPVIPEFTPTYWIMTALMGPLTLVIYGAAILRAEGVAQGAHVGIGESFAKGARKILVLVLAAICFVLSIMVGTVLLVIPGIILMVSLYLFLPAVLLDHKGPIDSLTYSHKLVWGNWWRTATIATIAVIIMYVILLLAGAVVGFMLAFTGTDEVTMFLVQIAATAIGSLVVMPFFVALYVEIYRDLKMRKAGGDLAARIASVGSAA
jgi:uncharacterized membrane protein